MRGALAHTRPYVRARVIGATTVCFVQCITPQVLGLEIGDAHVVRNAGGRASGDALRSIAISQRLLGTEEVVVIHHTGGRVTLEIYNIYKAYIMWTDWWVWWGATQVTAASCL